MVLHETQVFIYMILLHFFKESISVISITLLGHTNNQHFVTIIKKNVNQNYSIFKIIIYLRLILPSIYKCTTLNIQQQNGKPLFPCTIKQREFGSNTSDTN